MVKVEKRKYTWVVNLEIILPTDLYKLYLSYVENIPRIRKQQLLG